MKIIILKKVVTVNQGSDWKAHLLGNSKICVAGSSEEEAISNLQLKLSIENPHYKLIKHKG